MRRRERKRRRTGMCLCVCVCVCVCMRARVYTSPAPHVGCSRTVRGWGGRGEGVDRREVIKICLGCSKDVLHVLPERNFEAKYCRMIYVVYIDKMAGLLIKLTSTSRWDACGTSCPKEREREGEGGRKRESGGGGGDRSK
jgi:hypothetical protein